MKALDATARRTVPRIAIALATAILAIACADDVKDLPAVPVVETSGFEPSVIRALIGAREQFDRVASQSPERKRLAQAYGELAMTYHAQDLVAPASVAYANAQKLDPNDMRWPYLLGQLYNDAARLPEAITSLEKAVALDPRSAPALLALAQGYLQTGAFDKAQGTYERLRSVEGGEAAALAGLGRVALARRDYPVAIEHLEAALKLVPGATRLRQPLAMAYQGAGNRTKAEQNLREFSSDGFEPTVDDPFADALADKVAASRVLLRRGQRYGKSGRFDLAERAFRAAIDANPNDAEAVANLGISLANLGKLEEAEKRLVEALAKDDSIALAHFSLGVVHDRKGRDAAAIEHYAAARKLDPSNVQAFVYEGDALMRTGRAAAAIPLYREALDKSPGSPRIEMSLAMALLRDGKRAEALSVLEAAYAERPNNQPVTNALARILATAPESRLRDGARALAIAKKLFEATRSPEVGQTYAMALAETGSFTEAAKLQRETLIAYERSRLPVSNPALARNLASYDRGKPVREGWALDDPIFQPRSPAARLVGSTPAS